MRWWLALGGLAACAPSDDELRAIGQARLGQVGRTVSIGYITPERSARACCCPTDQRWFDLHGPPETCELWPDAAEDARFFRGSSYLDPSCLTREGFLMAREERRLVVSCANVACEGDATGAPAPLDERVPVFVPTPALDALAKPGTEPGSVDYYVGYDTLGVVHERDRPSLDTVTINFQLKETPTDLEQCVLEGRSRRPSNNRKQDFEFRHEDGAWR